MAEFILALDQGSHASRAIAFTREGAMLGKEQVPVVTENPRPGWFEHDAEALLQTMDVAIRQLLEQLPAADCLGAGLATQRSSIVCWDRDSGAALSPVLSWRDTRHQQWLASLELDPAWVHQTTGLRISAHYGASKLRWCLDHLPAVRAAQSQNRLLWGPLASFLVFRLTRERTRAADPVNASRTLLWDVQRRDWSDALLDRFGVDRGSLPAAVAEDHHFGHLNAGDGSIPLLRCTGDQSAALHARGQPVPASAYVNAGTGAFALRPLTAINNARNLLISVIRGDDSCFALALEGTVNGAATALDAQAQALGVSDWPRMLDKFRPDDTDIPVFLNGHAGLGSPWWCASFPCRYIGEGDPPACLRAVLESIVFMLAENLERCERAGQPLQRIVASGGLSRMPLFCASLASVKGIVVERPQVTEATARGVAWLCSGESTPWTESTEPDIYQPRPQTTLLARHRRWQAEMQQALADLAV